MKEKLKKGKRKKMQEVFDFAVKNWQFVLSFLALCLSLIFSVIRKRPLEVYDTIATIVLKNLPKLINLAETTSLKGHDKVIYVMDLLKQLFIMNGINFNENYQQLAEKAIEDILSTPQKKEAIL